MLDTVIKIGKLYREAPDAHKYHEQINHVWSEVENLRKQKNKDGDPVDVVFYELPVLDKGDSFEFDFDNLMEIEDEDKQKSLYRLNFKTSSGDSTSKYLFGDIVHSFVNERKGDGRIVTDDKGSYKLYSKDNSSILPNPSFYRASNDAEKTNNQTISKFRCEFERNINNIHKLFLPDQITIIHFKFGNRKWFQLEGLIGFIDFSLIENYVEKSLKDHNKFVLKKSLYKSLVGGEKKFYSFIPEFDREKFAYKGKSFSKQELLNIVYAKGAYTHRAVKAGAYSINVMPYYENIPINVLKGFFSQEEYSVRNENLKELALKNEAIAELASTDDFFFFDETVSPMLQTEFSKEAKFDLSFIWLNPSNKKYEDFVEIGTIDHSYIVDLASYIEAKAIEIVILSEKEGILKYPYKPKILKSFSAILKNKSKGDTLYNRYVIKVLPKIYLKSYYEDNVLLPSLIEQFEYLIRDTEKQFSRFDFFKLRYDFYFLMNIQQNNNLMKITDTQSYALGKNLGIMANNFAAWRDDCPIKSFEKSYVGNLSRRITNIDELVKFSGFLNEKLTIHGFMSKSKYIYIKNAYSSLVEIINNFEDEKYNRHNCALGFFESYYGKTNSNNEQQNN